MFGFGKKRKEVSIKEFWQEFYSRGGIESHEEVLRNDTIWRSCDRSMSPEKHAERGIESAIEILCGSDNWFLAKRFLDRSKEVIDTVIREDRLPRMEVYFPRNRAALHRAKVYVDSLLGEPWDRELLRSASRDLEYDWGKRYPDASDWDFLPEFQCITAIHMALLGGDIERAEQLLDNPPYPLDVYVEHAKLLKGVIHFDRNEFTENEQALFIAGYATYFDKVRDPRWEEPDGFTMGSFGSLELSLLRERFIRHPNQEIDWQRTIDEYSK